MGFIGRIMGFIFIVTGLIMLLEGYLVQGTMPEIKTLLEKTPIVGKYISPAPIDGKDVFVDPRPYYISGFAILLVGLAMRLTH